MYEDNGFTVNEKLQFFAVENYSNAYNGSRWNYKNFSTITDTAKNTWFRAPGMFRGLDNYLIMLKCLLLNFILLCQDDLL